MGGTEDVAAVLRSTIADIDEQIGVAVDVMEDNSPTDPNCAYLTASERRFHLSLIRPLAAALLHVVEAVPVLDFKPTAYCINRLPKPIFDYIR